MDTEKKPLLTVDTFKAENPEVYQSIFKAGLAEGEKKERDLFKTLQGVCVEDKELLVECFEQGKTEVEALKMRNEKLLKQLNEKPAEKPEAKAAPDPAKADFSDVGKKPEKKTDAEKTEADLKTEFAASKDLQAEFEKVENYLAYVNADKEGKISGKKPE